MKSASQRRREEGIEVRHARSCPSLTGGRCNCEPSYRAIVWSARDRKLVRSRWFRGDRAAAKAWRDDARSAARKGALRPTTRVTLKKAGEQLIAGMKDGSIRNRSGDRYKPKTIRGYEQALRLRVYPDLGDLLIQDVRRSDLQSLVEQMTAEDQEPCDPSTIRNTLLPVRVIYRRALSRDEVGVNPTAALELPAVRGRRDRIAAPEEAAELLAALEQGDRPIWATAFYAGLRAGELQALRWEDVNLAGGRIRVERTWDSHEGAVEPKSRSGRRTVPIPAVLHDHLAEHRAVRPWSTGLVFGRLPDKPFSFAVTKRARRAWEERKLRPLTLHDCRHTYASMMIAAGVNAKALSTFMGHASIQITYDLYGHLMPGSESEAASLLDAFLRRADTGGRIAALG